MLLRVQEDTNGLAVADLSDCTMVLRSLDEVRPVTGAAMLEVSQLLATRGFVYEVAHTEHLTVRRYGSALWRWLSEGFDSPLIVKFLADEFPVVEIGDSAWLQEVSWELLNTSFDVDNPDWFALRGVVRRRCGSTHEINQCQVKRFAPETLLITARPYAADDVPADVPARAIAEATDRHGRMKLTWLPSASRHLLRGVPEIGRRQLIHLDMHGTRLHGGIDGGSGTPYVLLEGDTGPDPCQIADLLELIPGSPPQAMLVTSCSADVTGLPVPQTLQGQALQHGVDLVIASRRRLTPDEVDTFSTGFYGSANFPTALDMATRDGRRALHEAAKTAERRVGGYAWASFTIYEAHEAAASRIPEMPLTRECPAPPPEVPQWLLCRPDCARVIVIQSDHDGYQDWCRRVKWWSRVLATPWEIREVRPPETLAGSADVLADALEGCQGPLIRMHNWTNLTSPYQMLDMAAAQGGASAAVVVPQVGLPVLDVIVACCAPEMLIDVPSPPDVTVFPAPTAWSVADLPPESSPLGRWLFVAECNLEPDAAQEAIGIKLYGADEKFDVLLARLTQHILNSGYHEDDLASGLASFSAGFWHHLDRAPHHEADAQVYGAMRSFCDVSYLAGLTRRKAIGRFVLDVFHPRLAAAIRRWIEARAQGTEPPWHEWPFRISINAPELGWHIDRAFPRAATLRDRLNRPDRVIGPELAAVTARNYVFHALIALNARGHPAIWWEKVGDQISSSDRRWFTAIRKTLEARTAHYAVRPLPAPHTEEEPFPPELLVTAILALPDAPPNDPPFMLMPTDSKSFRHLGFVMPESISREWLQYILDRTPWREDQAWYYEFGAFHSALQDPALAEELASQAIELSLAADGPHALNQCLDSLHTKAAIFRLTGRWNDWNDVMNLAVGLLRNVDWAEFATSVDGLLEEVTRGDLGRRLRLTGELLRAAVDRPGVDLTELIIYRSMALADGGRLLEADELLNGADLPQTAKKQRSIILAYRAEINAFLGNHAIALDFCVDLVNHAEGSVLAHAYSIEARVAGITGDYDRALTCFERGWAVEHGGTYADLCGFELCREFLRRGELDRCIDTAEQVRLRAHFPYSARACFPAAAAALARGEDETVIRRLLLTAFWALDSQLDMGLVWAMVHSGYERMINDIVDEVDGLTKAWMLDRSTVSAPPEVDVDRSEFSRYRLDQLLRRATEWRSISRELPEAELDSTEHSRQIIGDLITIVEIAREFLDEGDPQMALSWYRGAVNVLDDEGLADVADGQLLLSEAAYYVGSVSRQLGWLEDAIQ
jgi:hypothetical protein